MLDLDPRLRNARDLDGYLNAVAFVPFWGGDLDIWFPTDASRLPTPRQLRIVRAALDYPHDFRGIVQRFLFDHYQENVYQCIDFGSEKDEEDCAPRIDRPDQIWPLVRGPDIWIRWSARTGGHEDAIEFELAFDCSWDDEHGFSLLVRDWVIVRAGGNMG